VTTDTPVLTQYSYKTGQFVIQTAWIL